MIVLNNVTKKYNKGKKNCVCALDGIDLKINSGEMVAITGPSGAGKSTLLHILAGVLTFDEGSCIIDSTDIKSLTKTQAARFRNKKIGTVFQNFLLLENNSVIENVEVPLIISDVKKKKRLELCTRALEKAGISELAQRRVDELSGGQKQRVAIARAIVNDGDYIFADEPTGSLDSENTESIFSLFREICNQGKTVIIVTHDLLLAEKCDRQIVIKDGKVLA